LPDSFIPPDLHPIKALFNGSDLTCPKQAENPYAPRWFQAVFGYNVLNPAWGFAQLVRDLAYGQKLLLFIVHKQPHKKSYFHY
jgi:hypothetical protein